MTAAIGVCFGVRAGNITGGNITGGNLLTTKWASHVLVGDGTFHARVMKHVLALQFDHLVSDVNVFEAYVAFFFFLWEEGIVLGGLHVSTRRKTNIIPLSKEFMVIGFHTIFHGLAK